MPGITDPTEAYFKDGTWGWDGSLWRKLPLVWGYSALAGEALSNTNLGAGTNYLNGTAVSAGEVLVVRQVSLRYIGTVPTLIECQSFGTLGYPVLLHQPSPVSTQWYYEPCFEILVAGDYMRAYVAGATAGNNFYFRYSGYKMKIAE